jgi:hypothetical protein
LAIEALGMVEWSYSGSGFSPTCYWCRGYKNTPAMDQDYYGKQGHTVDCHRQAALMALRAVLAALTPRQE